MTRIELITGIKLLVAELTSKQECEINKGTLEITGVNGVSWVNDKTACIYGYNGWNVEQNWHFTELRRCLLESIYEALKDKKRRNDYD